MRTRIALSAAVAATCIIAASIEGSSRARSDGTAKPPRFGSNDPGSLAAFRQPAIGYRTSVNQPNQRTRLATSSTSQGVANYLSNRAVANYLSSRAVANYLASVAAANASAPAPAPAPAPASSPGVDVGAWQRVATCEEGGANDATFGYYGITPGSWAAYGGTQYSSTAGGATQEEQVTIANRISGGNVPDANGCSGW